MSGDDRINVRSLANAVHAMQAKEQNMQLFLLVRPDVFSSHAKQTWKCVRKELAAEVVVRAVRQYALASDRAVAVSRTHQGHH